MNQQEQAQATLDALTTKHTSWQLKRAQLLTARDDLQRNAGRAALEGQSTTKIADQLSRLTSEIEVAGSALATLETEIVDAKVQTQVAHISDLRARAVAKLQEGAASEDAIRPHLDAIEALTGVRYEHPRSPLARLEGEAHRLMSQADYEAGLLPDDVYRQLQAQREMAPTDVDQAIDRFQSPHAQQEAA